MPVPKNQIGAVIGTGGSVIKGLQDTTGAQISIVENDKESVVHVGPELLRIAAHAAAALSLTVCQLRRSTAALSNSSTIARTRYCRSLVATSR